MEILAKSDRLEKGEKDKNTKSQKTKISKLKPKIKIKNKCNKIWKSKIYNPLYNI